MFEKAKQFRVGTCVCLPFYLHVSVYIHVTCFDIIY